MHAAVAAAIIMAISARAPLCFLTSSPVDYYVTVALRPVSDTAPTQLITRDSRNLLQNGTGVGRNGAARDNRVELLLGGYGGPSPRRELLLPGIAVAAGDRS